MAMGIASISDRGPETCTHNYLDVENVTLTQEPLNEKVSIRT